jgi:hypothetical protein
VLVGSLVLLTMAEAVAPAEPRWRQAAGEKAGLFVIYLVVVILFGVVLAVYETTLAPLLASVRYVNDPLNPAFASRLEGLIERYQPAGWIHGHTHDPCDYELFRTRVVCNPRGYPGEHRQGGLKPELTVVV